MKIYKYYRIPDDDIKERSIYSDMSISDKYPLYAFTSEKIFAERFENERDMNKFIKSTTSLSRKEFASFAMQNRGADLKIQPLLTAVNKNTNKQILRTVKVLLTQNEFVACNEPSSPIFDEGWWYDITSQFYTNPYVFKKSISDALRILDYNGLHKIFNIVAYDNLYPEEDDDFSAPDIKNDELEYFVEIFGNTFK